MPPATTTENFAPHFDSFRRDIKNFRRSSIRVKKFYVQKLQNFSLFFLFKKSKILHLFLVLFKNSKKFSLFFDVQKTQKFSLFFVQKLKNFSFFFVGQKLKNFSLFFCSKTQKFFTFFPYTEFRFYHKKFRFFPKNSIFPQNFEYGISFISSKCINHIV